MNTTITIDYFYPTLQEPELAVLRVNDVRYVLGLRQQIHQEAMNAPGLECQITHICVPAQKQPLSEPQINALREKITKLMPGEYHYIALTALAEYNSIEMGHTTYVVVMRDSHNSPYITFINQSRNRAGNGPYETIFQEIRALIPDAHVIGKNGMINGIFPLGSFFYMCMESGVLLQKMQKMAGTNYFIEALQKYSKEYEATEDVSQSTELTYEQIIRLPATIPFLIGLEQLVLLRMSIGSAYRASLDIEQKNINNHPMSINNILDSQIISPQEMIRYLAGRRMISEIDDALQQNILETLPFVSMMELGSPQNLEQLLSDSLTQEQSTPSLDVETPESDFLFENLDFLEQSEVETDAALLFSLKQVAAPEPSFPKSREFLSFNSISTPLYTDILMECIDEQIFKEKDLKAKARLAAEFIVQFYGQKDTVWAYYRVKDFLLSYGLSWSLSCLAELKPKGRKRNKSAEHEIVSQLTSLNLLQLIAAAKDNADNTLPANVKPKKKRHKKA